MAQTCLRILDLLKLYSQPPTKKHFISVRRVPPQFSIPPEAYYEVMSGSDLNLTCVAVGSPMPYVKWRKGSQDVLPEVTPPIGKNVLTLTNIQDSSNYTCVAASKLGIIERSTLVRVQGNTSVRWYLAKMSDLQKQL